MAKRWQIKRLAQDELTLTSHQRLDAAYKRGFFDDLIKPGLAANQRLQDARDGNQQIGGALVAVVLELMVQSLFRLECCRKVLVKILNLKLLSAQHPSRIAHGAYLFLKVLVLPLQVLNQGLHVFAL